MKCIEAQLESATIGLIEPIGRAVAITVSAGVGTLATNIAQA